MPNDAKLSDRDRADLLWFFSGAADADLGRRSPGISPRLVDAAADPRDCEPSERALAAAARWRDIRAALDATALGTWGVLAAVYGPAAPADRGDLFGELATLVLSAPSVRALAGAPRRALARLLAGDAKERRRTVRRLLSEARLMRAAAERDYAAARERQRREWAGAA